MAGYTTISISDVTTKDPLSLYSRSKMVTASADTPRLSGHLLFLLVSLLVTVMRCCSTCLAAVTSQPNKQEKRYYAEVILDLVLVLKEMT